MRALLNETLRSNFFAFVRKAFRELSGVGLGAQPYLRMVCAYLEEFLLIEGARLFINLPPRHLKTFVASKCLAAWGLGRHPSANIMIVSCSEALAGEIAYDVRKIIRTSWYKEAFPTRVAPDRSSRMDFATIQGGRLFATTMAGAITGRGADLIIIDDPSEIRDGKNIDRLEEVSRHFDDSIRSRLNNPSIGRILIVQHRLSSEDLSGHVKRVYGYRPLVLPMVAPKTRTYQAGQEVWERRKGDVLRPEEFPPAAIKQMRRAANFETLYQQKPPETVLLPIKREHFAREDVHLGPSPVFVVSLDPGAGATSPQRAPSVVQLWYIDGDRYILIDQYRANASYQDLRAHLRQLRRQRRPVRVLIEATALGQGLISELQPAWREVEPVPIPRLSKIERLRPHLRLIRRRKIVLPRGAEWARGFIDEFTRFPDVEHTDQVDATTQFLDFMASRPLLSPPAPRALGVATGYTLGRIDPSPTAPAMSVPGAVLRLGRWRR